MQKREDVPGDFSKILISFLIYGITGILFGVVFIFIFSLIASNELISIKSLSYIPSFAVFFGAIISGYFSSRSMGKVLVTGLIQSLVNFSILYLLGVFVFMRIKPMGFNLYVFLACVLGAIIGGLITLVNVNGHRRHNT